MSAEMKKLSANVILLKKKVENRPLAAEIGRMTPSFKLGKELSKEQKAWADTANIFLQKTLAKLPKDDKEREALKTQVKQFVKARAKLTGSWK